MKAMYAAFLTIVVIALGAWYGLHSLGFSSAERSASENVRLGPGAE